MNSNQQINAMVCEILKPIIEARREALMQLIKEVKIGEELKLMRIKDALNQCKLLGSASKIKNVISMAGRSVISDDFFNQKTLTKNILPVRNGCCLDLITLEKRKRKKRDYFTFVYDADLTEKRKDAEGFLREFCPKKDTDTYTYLTEVLGYCLTPWNFMKSFFVFYGESVDNEKSVLLNIMEKLMGSNLYPSVDKKIFCQIQNNGGATPELCQCNGTFGEATSDLLDETTIKMITVDDAITVRQLYGESHAVGLNMKLLLSGNERPNWKN
jgi:phage/plasmid-associated DNA primase